MPDYVEDVLLARYIGCTVGELRRMPFWEVEQYQVVRSAEIMARNQVQGRKRT